MMYIYSEHMQESTTSLAWERLLKGTIMALTWARGECRHTYIYEIHGRQEKGANSLMI